MVRIELEGVTKRFAATVAVDRVSLDIPQGSLFFLLGPSGCGKTTCLRLLAGFYRPEEGWIRFDGRVVNHVPPHRRNTGMVFQNYALWPHLTVFQNVEYGLRVRKVPSAERRRRVMEMLERMGVAEQAHKYPLQLSGGQQQRVALARALVVKPDVLLLDEPLSNLDAALRIPMREEIRRIHREAGITSVYVTHDQADALVMADWIAVMRAGRIEQVGKPQEVYERPANAFVATFIGESNLLPATLRHKGSLWEVEAQVGPLRALPPAFEAQPGERVFCSIRPERLHLFRQEPPTHLPNRFPARVVHFTYLGHQEEYRLLVAERVEVKALRGHSHEPPFLPGEALWLGLSAEDVVIVKE